MGLDTDIYRVNRKKAEQCFCKSYIDGQPDYIDYFSINDDVVSVCYQRKHYPLQFLLEELTGRDQCEYHELTKLKAYHLLYCMQQNYKGQDAYDRKLRDQFVQKFKDVLHNFDWERDMMVWNWC